MSKTNRPERRLLLALLRAFSPAAISRRALTFGYTLMLEGQPDKALLKAATINEVLMVLEMDGWIEQIQSTHQQAWRWSGLAGQPYGELSEAESARLKNAVNRIKLESDT